MADIIDLLLIELGSLRKIAKEFASNIPDADGIEPELQVAIGRLFLLLLDKYAGETIGRYNSIISTSPYGMNCGHAIKAKEYFLVLGYVPQVYNAVDLIMKHDLSGVNGQWKKIADHTTKVRMILKMMEKTESMKALLGKSQSDQTNSKGK